MLTKTNKVEYVSKKLKKILRMAQTCNDYELMLEAIECYAFLHCSWNQQYADFEMERSIKYISDKIYAPEFSSKDTDPQTVIFHDGFAVDMWTGLSYIYVNALLNLGYRVIHLSNRDSEHRQPQLKQAMSGRNVIFEYYCMNGADRVTQSKDITRIINYYKPQMAFLCISPWDTATVLAYTQYQGIIKRFFINATDHSFWIGHNAFDSCIEFRNFGAGISMNYRKIDRDRLVILPYYPVVNYQKEFEGFPFKSDGYKIVFSGGAPYKTFDENNTFFKLVEAMLDKHEDVIFAYAPKSEELNCKEIQKKYPDRFFLLEMRKDLYQVLKHVDLYLGTYPVGGGLMMQFAAIAGRYMLVTAEDDDIRGMLSEEVEEQIFYNSIQEMAADLDLLLNNQEYLKEKEKLVENAVISETEFIHELGNIIQNGCSRFEINQRKYSVKRLERVFKERFDFQYIWNRDILRDEMRPKLLKFFPFYFIKKEIRVVEKLVKLRIKV